MNRGIEIESHPSRVRGLKYRPGDGIGPIPEVAPFTGAWIEIIIRAARAIETPVAPFTGAWIEINP